MKRALVFQWIAGSAALAVAVGGNFGCATSKPIRGSGEKPVVSVQGIWEGFGREVVGATEGGPGDTRLERQAWRLTQVGDQVKGFYVIELTMVSGDGRPYLCSGTPRFQTLLRFEVTGLSRDGAVELEETRPALVKGPCRPGFRTPARLRAEPRGEALVMLNEGAPIMLFRRPPGQTADVMALERVDASWKASGELVFPDAGRMTEAAPADIQGIWTWEHRGTATTGDEQVEREEWHLVQQGSRLLGYYDRVVRQISTDGHAFRCSNSMDFRVVTRYQVTGEVRGNHIAVHERGFEILEGGPCDNGQRRLDVYQGEARSGELHLMWGVGRQVLRRARPTLPTQRF